MDRSLKKKKVAFTIWLRGNLQYINMMLLIVNLLFFAFVNSGQTTTSITRSLGSVSFKNQPQKYQPWHEYIARSSNNVASATKGESGEEWTWCTHLVKYGPNFDRGLANFLSGILKPASALEFGCGIGLYINYMQQFSDAENKDPSRFIGIEPESMIDAGVFGSDNYLATQTALNIFKAKQDVLNSLGTFDLVFSSEVAEHIPVDLHDKLYDFLVSKTIKFLVFGASRPGQGGTGHLQESMHPIEYFIEKFKKKGLIHLPKLSQRLRAACYNGWDKGRNTFVMVTKEFFDSGLDDRLSGLNDISDIFPQFWTSKMEKIHKKQICY